MYYEFASDNLENKKIFVNEFDPKIITQLNSNSKFLKEYTMYDTANAITSLINSKIVNLKNEEVIVISEQIVELELGTTIGDDYFNILVTRINKSGINNQPYVIPKLQSGRSKSYYSYLDFIKNDKFYLIYNDNPKNDNADPYKIVGGLNAVTGSSPFLVSFSDNGVWSKKTLFDVNENTSYIHPAKFFYKNATEIMIYGKKENKIKFAIIKL